MKKARFSGLFRENSDLSKWTWIKKYRKIFRISWIEWDGDTGCRILVPLRNLRKIKIWNLIKSKAWDENSLCSNSFISGLNIRYQLLCFSYRFLRVARIPHPVSPVYSIRKKFLNISAFSQCGSPESFWMRLSEEGEREFWWLWNEFRKIGTWESASGSAAASVRAYAS